MFCLKYKNDCNSTHKRPVEYGLITQDIICTWNAFLRENHLDLRLQISNSSNRIVQVPGK